VSRRRRSVAFLLAALAAAAAAAALAQRYGSSVARGYGPLRPVVVTDVDLPAKRLDGKVVSSALLVRRVPERFVPPDALASPTDAIGLVPASRLPAGSYLLASQLRPPHPRRPPGRPLATGRSPVEITVSGAGALLTAGMPASGSKVDVVVSRPVGAHGARIAASSVPLLALRPGAEGDAPGATAAATLGLTRSEALRLIAAEGEARRMTLLYPR
jgi:Flp pilus assembly protein CpaB